MCLIKFLKRIVLFIFVISIMLLLFMSKCSWQGALDQVKDKVIPDQISVEIPAEQMHLANQIKDQIAVQNGVDASQIEITHFEFIMWPDACLGQTNKTNCDQVVTPGYKIKVKIGSVEMEYHSDKSGTRLVKIN